MNVARILYPVEVLGPGKRIGIWLCGCHRECKGCSNPELWQEKAEYELPISDVVKLIRRIQQENAVDGFTISGGEPFNQTNELLELILALEEISKDILIYTGYKLQELIETGDKNIMGILDHIAVLIDGEYIDELNDGSLLRGSSNQRIHVLSEEYKGYYDEYLAAAANRIQNFTTTDGVISVGIHNREWRQYS